MTGQRRRWFATTNWSMVLAAGARSTRESTAALERLCRTYWQPLYLYARRTGCSAEDAEDLTQAFFARLLDKNDLLAADPERGRFRSFLLTSFKHFVANEWRREGALKRGGGAVFTHVDIETAESRLEIEPADTRTPQETFERRWALCLLQAAFTRLRSEYDRPEKLALFDAVKGHLAGETVDEPTYRETASRFGMTEGALKVTVHRMKKRFREALMAEVADTVASPETVDQEIRYLFEILSR